jgi:hypothetical protein
VHHHPCHALLPTAGEYVMRLGCCSRPCQLTCCLTCTVCRVCWCCCCSPPPPALCRRGGGAACGAGRVAGGLRGLHRAAPPGHQGPGSAAAQVTAQVTSTAAAVVSC